jgi:hypothetical protein
MLISTLLIFLATLARLLPHPANFAPIGGLALFTGATALYQRSLFGRLLAFVLPLVALLVSDAIIGFYSWQIMIAVYLGFGLTSLIGLIVHRYYSVPVIMAGSLASTVIFFLLTNAAVWAFTPMYAKDLTGLIESYVMAIPFFRNSLLGDLSYTGLLFGVYELAQRKISISNLGLTLRRRSG